VFGFHSTVTVIKAVLMGFYFDVNTMTIVCA